MRKSAFLLILSFVLSCFFSCDFAVPKAIEITGTPSIRFAETVDVGKMFTDLLTEAINKDDRLTIIPCSKTKVITCLIHTDLLNKEFDAINDNSEIVNLHPHFPGMDLFPSDFDVTLLSDKILIDASGERLLVPLSEVGSLFEGFTFEKGDVGKEGYRAKLYLSGSPLVAKTKIDIIIEEYDSVIDDYINKKIETKDNNINKKSKIETWKTKGVYSGGSCPDDGIELDIPITGKDIALSFKVYIPAGKEISVSDFNGGNINVELVVWLPFVFKAGADGAKLSFPEDSFFSSDDDLFYRDEAGDDSLFTDIVESLAVDVMFKNSPFMGADLVISSKGIDIHNRIENDTLSFGLTEENMKAINNPVNFPFTPKISIDFPSGAELKFPRVFQVIEFGFKAKIRYRIDF